MATSFIVVSTNVTTNLIDNGNFDSATPDLNSGTQGSLTGWQTYAQTNSNGAWDVQTPNLAVGYSTSVLSQNPGSGARDRFVRGHAGSGGPRDIYPSLPVGFAGLEHALSRRDDPGRRHVGHAVVLFVLRNRRFFLGPNGRPRPGLHESREHPRSADSRGHRESGRPAAANPLDVTTSVLENLFQTNQTTFTFQPYSLMTFRCVAVRGPHDPAALRRHQQPGTFDRRRGRRAVGDDVCRYHRRR